MKLGIRELLFATVMVAMLALSYQFVFRRATQHRAERLADIDRWRSQVTSLREATAGVDDLNKMVVDLEQAIHFFDSKLPQEREIDSILKEVWQMAEANQLQTKTIKTMKAENNANYSELPIQLQLSGNFYGYYSFLQQLEKLPRITRVTQMNLTKISDRDGEMQAHMTLSIFFEPEQKSVASAY